MDWLTSIDDVKTGCHGYQCKTHALQLGHGEQVRESNMKPFAQITVTQILRWGFRLFGTSFLPLFSHLRLHIINPDSECYYKGSFCCSSIWKEILTAHLTTFCFHWEKWAKRLKQRASMVLEHGGSSLWIYHRFKTEFLMTILNQDVWSVLA